jgi:DNA repair protein RAD51
MTADMETQEIDESGLPGPGAPTPLSSLEVRRSPLDDKSVIENGKANFAQGMAGLTSRDIKLFVDAGYHTVESIAYKYVLTHFLRSFAGLLI